MLFSGIFIGVFIILSLLLISYYSQTTKQIASRAEETGSESAGQHQVENTLDSISRYSKNYIDNNKWESIQKGQEQILHLPSGLPMLFTVNLDIQEGSIAVNFGEKERIIDVFGQQTVEILSLPSELSEETKVAIVGRDELSSFTIGYTEVKELNMSETAGRWFHDEDSSYSSLENSQSSVVPEDKSEVIDPSVESVLGTMEANNSNIIYQTIPVIIGMSHQVVENHCEGPLDQDGLCSKVKTLALRDLELVNERFKETGKKLEFIRFDSPWDQASSKDLGCGNAKGGQVLPPLVCKHDKDKLYIAILYVVKDSRWNGISSGGDASPETDKASLRYVAPFKDAQSDFWEYQEGGVQNLSSANTLSHEFGHICRQIHTPWVPGKNDPFYKTGYYLYYMGDLRNAYVHDMRNEWVLELTKRARCAPVEDKVTPFNSVPDKLTLNLIKNEKYRFDYGSYNIYPTSGGDGEIKLLPQIISAGDIIINSSVKIFTKDLFSKYPLLLLIINDINGDQYYTWLSLMEVNLAYWNSDSPTSPNDLKIDKYAGRVDPSLKVKIEKASQKKVSIDLFVKGICGLGENQLCNIDLSDKALVTLKSPNNFQEEINKWIPTNNPNYTNVIPVHYQDEITLFNADSTLNGKVSIYFTTTLLKTDPLKGNKYCKRTYDIKLNKEDSMIKLSQTISTSDYNSQAYICQSTPFADLANKWN